jgi:preprotein translocase subunit SecG
MSIIVTVLHVVACFVLIVVVLLQTGKGADIGAVFGGSSQTIFGSSGAGNLLTRLTTWTAVVFMLTSLFLTWSSTHHLTSSIADTIPDEPPPLAAPLDGDAASVTDGTTTVTPQDDGATADAAAPAAEVPAAEPAAPVEAEPAAPAADADAAPANGDTSSAPAGAAAPAAEPAPAQP